MSLNAQIPFNCLVILISPFACSPLGSFYLFQHRVLGMVRTSGTRISLRVLVSRDAKRNTRVSALFAVRESEHRSAYCSGYFRLSTHLTLLSFSFVLGIPIFVGIHLSTHSTLLSFSFVLGIFVGIHASSLMLPIAISEV